MITRPILFFGSFILPFGAKKDLWYNALMKETIEKIEDLRSRIASVSDRL
jgi:hypothetical protein